MMIRLTGYRSPPNNGGQYSQKFYLQIHEKEPIIPAQEVCLSVDFLTDILQDIENYRYL